LKSTLQVSISPANQHILTMGDAGFEPATSAV
jgi:hypothetical protein